jgi:hypothetical protein
MALKKIETTLRAVPIIIRDSTLLCHAPFHK